MASPSKMPSGGAGSGGGGMEVLGLVVSLDGTCTPGASLGVVEDTLRTGRGLGGIAKSEQPGRVS